MLVDPLEASITVPLGFNLPLRTAFPIMYRAILSLVEPLGLRNSSLHQITGSSADNWMGISGVGGSSAGYRLIVQGFVSMVSPLAVGQFNCLGREPTAAMIAASFKCDLLLVTISCRTSRSRGRPSFSAMASRCW